MIPNRKLFLILALCYLGFSGYGLFFSEKKPVVTESQVEELEEMMNQPAINTSEQAASLPRTETDSSKKIFPDFGAAGYQSSYGPLAHSLRGTTIPAYFEIDSEGHLIITPSIKSVIEYFLSALGEEPIETIVGRIEEYFLKQLSEPASSEALEVLTEYLHYKEALVDLERMLAENNINSASGSDYLSMFEYRREARQNHLSPQVYEAFFAEEDRRDAHTAEMIKLQKQSKDQPPSEAQLSSLDSYLNEEDQAHKAMERQRNLIQAAKQSGATDQELFEMRSTVYGTEAAERFALADKKQSEWNTRFQDYRTQRQSILKGSGLSDQDKRDEINRLQIALFEPNERKRLPTLDKMADRQASQHLDLGSSKN